MTPNTPSSSTIPRPDSASRRQHFSCAECRRLKLKCSRSWPCTSCEKRGLAQICPNGQMKSLKGKRLVLSDTEELHQRIQVLELALSQERAKTSSAPHPLLESEYQFGNAKKLPPSVDDVAEGVLGQLKISAEGEAHYVGPFAGSEYLRNEEGSSSPSTPNENAQGAAVHASAQGAYANLHDFLVGSISTNYDLERLRAELPDWDTEGHELLECYWENVNWMYQILPRTMFESDHLPNAYRAPKPQAHKLACVFFMMAIGVIFDLTREPWHSRAHHLFYCGRVCLGLAGLEHASPATVQAMHLMGTFIMNDKIGNSADVFWPILGAAVKISQSLGLHRDGARWGGGSLSDYEIQERRQVYWEILTYDRLQSMCFGRPCAMSNRTSDTQYPDDETLISDLDGFHRTKYRLMHMMESVIDIQTQTTGVSYSACSKLDEELVSFRSNLPAELLPGKQISELPLDRMINPQTVIHRLSIRFLISQTRLLLNRHWFMCALKENPSDPSENRFNGAFHACYESCTDIVNIIKQLVLYHPSLIARWWFFWFHALSAATCLAAVAIHAPGSVYASPAFTSLSHICDIASAARDGCRARNGLSALRYLKGTAQRAIENAAKQYGKLKRSPSEDAPDRETETYLDHLKSQTRVVRLGSPATQSPVVSSPGDRDRDRDGEYPASVPAAYMMNQQFAHNNADGSPAPLVEYSPEAFMANLWQHQMPGMVQPLPQDYGQLGVDTDTSIALGMPQGGGFEFDPFASGVGVGAGVQGVPMMHVPSEGYSEYNGSQA